MVRRTPHTVLQTQPIKWNHRLIAWCTHTQWNVHSPLSRRRRQRRWKKRIKGESNTYTQWPDKCLLCCRVIFVPSLPCLCISTYSQFNWTTTDTRTHCTAQHCHWLKRNGTQSNWWYIWYSAVISTIHSRIYDKSGLSLSPLPFRIKISFLRRFFCLLHYFSHFIHSFSVCLIASVISSSFFWSVSFGIKWKNAIFVALCCCFIVTVCPARECVQCSCTLYERDEREKWKKHTHKKWSWHKSGRTGMGTNERWWWINTTNTTYACHPLYLYGSL